MDLPQAEIDRVQDIGEHMQKENARLRAQAAELSKALDRLCKAVWWGTDETRQAAYDKAQQALASAPQVLWSGVISDADDEEWVPEGYWEALDEAMARGITAFKFIIIEHPKEVASEA